MENHQTANSPNPLPGKEISELKEKIKQYKSAVPVSFVLIIVFFFFGFCNFKCNGTEVASLSGINLVTGTHLKTKMDNAFNSFGNMGSNSSETKGEKVHPNFWAILAFLSAIAGVVVFFKIKEKENLWGTVFGATGFLSLVILGFVIKSKTEDQGQGMANIETSFLFGYWASILAFLVAGGISYLRLKDKNLNNPVPSKQPEAPHSPIHINVITTNDNKDSV